MEDNILKIYDPLRDKYVALTQEEYVRRHFTQWMIDSLNYPASNIANEVGLRVNDTLKRCDTLVIDRYGAPLMIVEYKAPVVEITQKTFDQIVRYNMKLNAKYLIVSNGLNHYCCKIDYKANNYQFIARIPDYKELIRDFSDN
ncbi:MAG: type I restriction enzyme HsdR N-terminal domain-containing protein [Muribaculaceae bacterium]|nr:type I restriction enzyme HsdR N-terminal domain-containing protein [Muribaculaceae bacterium]